MPYKIQLSTKVYGTYTNPEDCLAGLTYANQNSVYGKQIDLLDPLPQVRNFLDYPEETCYRIDGMKIIQNGVVYVYTELDEAIAAAEALEMDYDNYYYFYFPFPSKVRYFPTEGLASIYKWMKDTYQESREIGLFDYPATEYVFYDGPLKGKQLPESEWSHLSESEIKPKHLLAPNNLKIEHRDDDMIDEYLQGLSEDPQEVHVLPFIYLHGELEDSNLQAYENDDNSCAPDLCMANLTVRDITELAKKQEGVTNPDTEGLIAEIECHANGEPALCVVRYDAFTKRIHGRVAWLSDAKGLAHAKDTTNWR